MAHSQSVNCSLDDIDLNALKVSSFLFISRRGMRGDEGFIQWTSGVRWRMWILGGTTKYFSVIEGSPPTAPLPAVGSLVSVTLSRGLPHFRIIFTVKLCLPIRFLFNQVLKMDAKLL